MTTWEEIRDNVAGMLADGYPLEKVIAKLEKQKNEMAKATLLKTMDEMKNPKPKTNDEWRKTCSAEEFAEWISNLAYSCMRCGMSNGEAYCHTGYCIQDKEDAEKWLKEKHSE